MSYPVILQNTNLLEQLDNQIAKAEKKHKKFPTAHHAMGVIDEEVHEFKLEVYKQELDKKATKKELLHVAASAIRAIKDLGLDE